jgi:hypothetical protein
MTELLEREISKSSGPRRREIIDENRAAYLLGMPPEQLREICEFSGLGSLAEDATTVRLVFTYEELFTLCRLIVGPAS